MTTATSSDHRTFTPSRAAQGFKSQAHLDAWFKAFDHRNACPECLRPGAPAEIDDGLQPTLSTCPEAEALDRARRAIAYATGP